MKQKQEVWRFDNYGRLMRVVDGHCNGSNYLAYVDSQSWTIYAWALIGGIVLLFRRDGAESAEAAKIACAKEIKRQLAAHGVKVEIRRAKR